MKTPLAVLALSLVTASISHAQVSAASINGTARDTSGASIPSATIIAHNTETNIDTRTTTNEQGVYFILHLLPGPYTIEASKEGFAARRLGPINLVVNQRSIFDFELSVGKVQDSVTVEAIGAQLQSATAELGSALSRQQVVDLPLGRNIQNMMRLTPGVNAVTTGQSSIPSVNGQINRSSMYMLDGVNNQATFFSNLALNPIIETIEEFKVQSHNDSVEVGGVMGGVINTATKSGTNALHGNVYNIEQNDAFNARNAFLTSVAPFKGHTFGGTAGGPVTLPKLYNGRNRTFFFAGYQYFMSRAPAFSFFRVPTEANLNGNFSDWPKQIFNPFTTRPDPSQAGTFARDPFPGNQIPVSLFKPGMVYYARSVLPAPEATGIADRNAVNRALNRAQVHSLNTRIDHKFTDMDSVWFRYSGTYAPTIAASSIPAISRLNNGRAHNLAGNWVHTFGPSAVLQVSFGRVFQWTSSSDRFNSLPADFIQRVGYSANVNTGYLDGSVRLPAFNPANFWSGGEQYNLSRTGDSWHYKAGYTKLLGTHTLKFGGEYNRVQWYYENGVTSVGFADAQTANPRALATTGSSLASFLLDVPDSATRRDIIETMPWWGGTVGFYFQDSWKATSKLTLNLGLRYDRTFIPTAGTDAGNNNMVGNMDYNRGKYVIQKIAPPCATAGKSPCIPAPAGAPAGWLPANVEVSPTGKVYQDTKLNFQPRLGAAYRAGSRLVLRASAGVFFDNYSGVTQLARNFIGTWPSLGFQSAALINYPSSAQALPSVSGTNPLPSAVLPLADPFVQTAYFGDPNWKNAYSIQWNGGFQYQATPSFMWTMNYVGSGTHRTTVGGRYNVAITPGPGNFRDRSPFPYMAVPTSWDRSWGNANYHALQTSFERRFAKGFALTTSYTWSKSIDPGSSGFFGVEGNSIQNPYSMRPDRSVSSYDVPHNLVLSWVYDLPMGKNKLLHTGNRVADYILGNWQINGIADIRSGTPVNVTISGDIANTGNVNYLRPNLVGEWRVDNPTPGRWFDRSAFAPPAQFTFGNLGRNVLRTDSVRRFDMSVFRNIPINERAFAQLRFEGYNVFNTVTYNAPTAEFTNVNFGRVLGAAAARSLQIGARIYF